jgi:hypothetical protein
MPRKPAWQVPFRQDGSLITEAPYWDKPGVEWRDPFEFEAVMNFVGFYRDGHAVGGVLHDTNTSLTYHIFLHDLGPIIQRGISEGGIISGTWAFAKRGRNYGIRLITARLEVSE